jgi:hypothetical protein
LNEDRFFIEVGETDPLPLQIHSMSEPNMMEVPMLEADGIRSAYATSPSALTSGSCFRANLAFTADNNGNPSTRLSATCDTTFITVRGELI